MVPNQREWSFKSKERQSHRQTDAEKEVTNKKEIFVYIILWDCSVAFERKRKWKTMRQIKITFVNRPRNLCSFSAAWSWIGQRETRMIEWMHERMEERWRWRNDRFYGDKRRVFDPFLVFKIHNMTIGTLNKCDKVIQRNRI